MPNSRFCETFGEFAPGRYHIQLGPRLNRGTVFEVWLEDQVKADESLTYEGVGSEINNYKTDINKIEKDILEYMDRSL